MLQKQFSPRFGGNRTFALKSRPCGSQISHEAVELHYEHFGCRRSVTLVPGRSASSLTRCHCRAARRSDRASGWFEGQRRGGRPRRVRVAGDISRVIVVVVAAVAAVAAVSASASASARASPTAPSAVTTHSTSSTASSSCSCFPGS